MGIRILIDGNDGVGKTTLAKRLGQDLGIQSYIHLSYNDPRSFGFYHNIIQKNNVIFDRSFMDEIVYSTVFKRDIALTFAEFATLHVQLKELDVIVIIAKSDDKIYSNDEASAVVDNEKFIDDYFKQVAESFNYIVYDTRLDSYDELLAKIKQIKDLQNE